MNFALTAAYFIGFFRWKKYAWYCLFAQLISEAVLYTATFILSVFILPQYTSTVIGVLIGFLIRGIPMGIYYYKRRGLFSTEGYNPKAAKTETSPVLTAGRICPACGKEIAADTRFCTHCGKALEEPQADLCAAETASAADTAPQCADSTAVCADSSDYKETDANAYIPMEKETALPASEGKAVQSKAGKKMVIALTAACICAAALGVLNIVQYTQLKNYKAENAALVLKNNTLNETIDGYSKRVAELNSYNQKAEASVAMYDTIAEFVSGEMPKYKSKTFYASDYIVFVPMGAAKHTFTVTANFNSAKVSFSPAGDSVAADFAENWNGNSIDIHMLPQNKGLTTLYFSNDQNSETFKVLVFVV